MPHAEDASRLSAIVRVIELVESAVRPTDSVIVLGSADTQLARQIRQRMPENHLLVVDSMPTSFGQVDYPDDHADAVVSAFAFQAIADDAQKLSALQEASRLVKAGGLLLVADHVQVPSLQPKPEVTHPGENRRERRISDTALRVLIRSVGFACLKIEHISHDLCIFVAIKPKV